MHPRLTLPDRGSLPALPDLVLGAGAVALTAAVLLVLGLPAYHRLEDRARLAAVRGNAATVQLAAESYAAQHLGAYPTDPLDLVPYLPGGRPPRNPLTGERLVFANVPGDVTYSSPTGGRDYLIRAWGFGPGEVARPVATLTSVRG